VAGFGEQRLAECLTTDWTIGGRSPAEVKIIFPSVSRPALGPTQPPMQWVPGILSAGVKRGRGVTLTTHPHLVPRSRMSKSYNSSPPKRLMACSGTALDVCYRITPLVDITVKMETTQRCVTTDAWTNRCSHHNQARIIH
jgi:hypothetical protein